MWVAVSTQPHREGMAIDNLLRQRKNLFQALVNKKPAIELSPAPVVVTTGDENFLKEVIAIVEEKMTDPGFNLETVAAGMKMSKSTFYKKFKSLTSILPVEFVRDMRLQRARQYLDYEPQVPIWLPCQISL